MPGKTITSFWLILSWCIFLSSCKTNDRFVARRLREPFRQFLRHPLLGSSHVGVFMKEAGKEKPLLSFQKNKRFIPASNVKILTAYLALKSGQDSSITARVINKNYRHLLIEPMMDPAFLHADFQKHNFLDTLVKYDTLTFIAKEVVPYGPGWAWEDFDRFFMPEISAFPMYGNVVKISRDSSGNNVYPGYFKDSLSANKHAFRRVFCRNQFNIPAISKGQKLIIPFIPDKRTLEGMLRDTLGNKVIFWLEGFNEKISREIKGQPMDTLIRLMMARSDNFYADHLLHHVAECKDWHGKVPDWYTLYLPAMNDHPVLVDGSGLSRYNLISPSDLCVVLEKKWDEVGAKKIRNLYTCGYDAALEKEFGHFGENLLAKTGSMSGIFCLSGYLKSSRGKNLIFSVMINGHVNNLSNCKLLINNLLKEVYNAY